MVQESQESRLDEFVIKGNVIYRDGQEIIRFPTAVAEIARLEDRLFVILSVPDPEADLLYTGTNLWSIDLNGKIIWKAPNLNATKGTDQFFHWKCYSDLRLFDKRNPKVKCYVDERRGAMLQAYTGTYVTDVHPTNWNQNYDKAWQEHKERTQATEESIFIESLRICDASKHNPVYPRSKCPPSLRVNCKP